VWFVVRGNGRVLPIVSIWEVVGHRMMFGIVAQLLWRHRISKEEAEVVERVCSGMSNRRWCNLGHCYTSLISVFVPRTRALLLCVAYECHIVLVDALAVR